MLLAGLEDSAAEYMAKQLVSGLAEAAKGCFRSLPGLATSHSNGVSFTSEVSNTASKSMRAFEAVRDELRMIQKVEK